MQTKFHPQKSNISPQLLSHKVLFDLTKADFVAVHAEAFMDIGIR